MVLSVLPRPSAPASLDERPTLAVLADPLLITRVALTVAVAVLVAVAIQALLASGGLAVALAVAGATAVLAVGGLAHHHLVTTSSRERVEQETAMRRLVAGLSRALNPDQIVEAVIAEVRAATGADHVAVARVLWPRQDVEVTLTAVRGAAAPSATVLRAGPASPVTDDRGPRDAQDAADEIAGRIRAAFGIADSLAAPLTDGRRLLGALVLTRRTRRGWSEADRRLLAWARDEVAAALARTYAHEAAERSASTDGLTGLANRRTFEALLDGMPRRRAADSVAILMADLDHFKRINDVHGHPVGDAVLRRVADAVAASIRGEDTAARYGGEEFAVVLRHASTVASADVAERIRAAIAAIPVADLGFEGTLTASLGVAVAGDGEDIRAAVARADRALYAAKHAGRDRVAVA